ncbi:MAG: T9SS type A sorting domain-containing protein [Dysgonomonas sp.]|nr:T9SS type A sorting domain-containing protein [Dysgonomonas sp.]
MKYTSKILIIVLLCALSVSGFAQKRDINFDDEKPKVELTINGEKFVVNNLPQEGIIEIFNILGSKVMSFSVKGGVNVNRINLPEGYYILKSDNATKKIVVK